MTDRIERERQFHNEIFAEGARRPLDKYYSTTRAATQYFESILDRFRHGTRVLEYGCGQGSYSYRLARNGADVAAFDLSDVAVLKALNRQRAENPGQLSFAQMNAEHLGFASATFDLVCGVAILHHLDLKQALSEISRVLRPGGIAAFLEPLGHNPLINLYRTLTPRMRSEDEHPLLMSDLDLARQQFADVDLRFFSLATLAAVPFVKTRGFETVLSAAEAVDRGILSTPLRRFAWQTVIVLKKSRQ
jgi:SAM-dependent methyltransferase